MTRQYGIDGVAKNLTGSEYSYLSNHLHTIHPSMYKEFLSWARPLPLRFLQASWSKTQAHCPFFWTILTCRGYCTLRSWFVSGRGAQRQRHKVCCINNRQVESVTFTNVWETLRIFVVIPLQLISSCRSFCTVIETFGLYLILMKLLITQKAVVWTFQIQNPKTKNVFESFGIILIICTPVLKIPYFIVRHAVKQN